MLPYVFPYWPFVTLAVGLVLIGTAAQLTGPYLTRIALDDYIAAGDLEGLIGILGLYAVILAVGFAGAYGQAWIVNLFGQRVMRDIRRDVFDHIQKLHPGWFDRHPIGQVVTRATSDVDALNELLSSGVVMIITDVVLLVGIMAVLIWMNPALALVTFGAVPALFIAGWIFRRRIRPAFRRVRTAVASVNSFIQETLTGMEVLQLFRQERRRAREYRKLNREHTDAHLDTVLCFSVFYPVVEMITAITVALIVGYGGSRIGTGTLTVGALVAFLMYSEMFFRPIRDLTEKFNILQGAMAASERIVELLDTEPAIRNAPAARLPAHRHGAFRLEGVSFAYNKEEWVLRDIDLDVAPGETVALVGHTGSGKTTLAALLLRLYDVQRGRVLVDGLDVRDWRVPNLRRQFSMVQQDVHLFSGSVLDNIRLGDETISEEDARRAAEAAEVAAWARNLPDGLDTQLGERGGGLSQGQRQLVGIARAMARSSRVLVLDEATSSVDTETERAVQTALQRVLENRTSLVIAHRLSTIRGADRIVVLHRGRSARAAPTTSCSPSEVSTGGSTSCSSRTRPCWPPAEHPAENPRPENHDMTESLTLDQAGVLEVLPHREPFLFVHGVSELVPGKSGRGFVTVPADHPYTLGQPHLPAGLIIEAMAQLGGIAVLYERRDENLVVLFRSVKDFVMERTVDFGQRLDLFAEVSRFRGRFAEVQTSASTEGQPVASATLAFALP